MDYYGLKNATPTLYQIPQHHNINTNTTCWICILFKTTLIYYPHIKYSEARYFSATLTFKCSHKSMKLKDILVNCFQC